MKKKDNALFVSILFFIAAFVILLFIFLEFRSYYLAVFIAFIVFLASSYLLFDKLIQTIQKGFSAGKKEILYGIEDLSIGLKDRVEEIERTQKALYMETKKHITFVEEKLDFLCNEMQSTEVLKSLDRIREVLESINKLENTISSNGKTSNGKINQILQQQRASLEAQENSLKLILKYNKENARQVALNANSLFEKENQFWSETLGTIGDLLSASGKALLHFDEKLSGVTSRSGNRFSSERQKKKRKPESEELFVLPDLKEESRLDLEDAFVEETIEEPQVAPEYTMEPELVDIPTPAAEPVVVPEPSADPNHMMSPDEIAAMVAGMSAPAAEPQPVVIPEPSADPNRMMSPDEIAAMVAGMSAPAAEPVVVPEPSTDPNHMMSPDEIAAMVAGMSAPAAEPVVVPEPSTDPNHMMSSDEIAAMIAGMSAPAAEPVVVPESNTNPNHMMSPDEIAAMIANMNG